MPSPTAVLVTVTWFCMCILHMLCQTAENEGVEFSGEAGVFPSLLPDNAPSGAWEPLPPTPCQSGNKHAQLGWQGKMGSDRNWGMREADIILSKTRLKLVRRKQRVPEAETLRFHTDPRGVKVTYEAKVQSNFMEVKARNININANSSLWCFTACLNFPDCLNQDG